MFGLSTKERQGRAIEALQRRTKAILVGGFFHVDDTNEYGINEKASAWLYTEALAHQVYDLFVISNTTLAKKHTWATAVFAIKAINETITEYELEEGRTPGPVSSFIFKRCAEMDSLTGQERQDGEHFWQSARKIAELDSSADQEAIASRLYTVAEEYFNNAVKMFR